jgi:glycerophosphoryl diester phosphodiesterase
MFQAKKGRQNLPAIVAHRGASSTHPENTLESFASAIEAGADAVELDVRMTVDGVPIVMHDADVSRTTDGGGLVRDLRVAEIGRLRIRGAGNEGVPSLKEVLELCSGRIGVDVEIKNVPGEPDFDSSHARAAEATCAVLSASKFTGQVLIASFDSAAIARSREFAPEVPTGLLTIAPLEEASLPAHVGPHEWLLPLAARVFAAGESIVSSAKSSGILVGAWTVDEPAAAVRLMRWGVDAVVSNDPAAIVEARREAFGR